MTGYTMLADRVASLLPNTTAGACVPRSSWSERQCIDEGPPGFPIICCAEWKCHYSCFGASVCTSPSRICQ